LVGRDAPKLKTTFQENLLSQNDRRIFCVSFLSYLVKNSENMIGGWISTVG